METVADVIKTPLAQLIRKSLQKTTLSAIVLHLFINKEEKKNNKMKIINIKQRLGF